MTLGLIFHHFWLDCVFCVNSKGSHDSCSCDMLHYQKKICRYLLVLSSWMSLNFLFLFLWVIVSYPTILKIKLIINHKEILFELFASEIIIKKKQNEENWKVFNWDKCKSDNCKPATSKVQLFIRQ